MMRKTGLIALEIAAGIAVALLLAAGALAWVAANNSVRIDFLKPYVEQALENAGIGDRIDIGHAALVWNRQDNQINVRIDDLAAYDSGEDALWQVNQIDVAMVATELFLGKLVPRRVILSDAHLRVVRTEDSRIFLSIAREGAMPFVLSEREKAVENFDFARWLEQMSQPPSRTGRGQLREVQIKKAFVEFDDRNLGRVWQVHDAALNFTRGSDGLAINARLPMRIDETQAMITVALASPVLGSDSQHPIRIDATFERLIPSAFGELSPRLSPLSRLKAELGGRIHATLDSSLRVRNVDYALNIGEGRLNLPPYYPEPLEIEGATLSGSYDHQQGSVTLDQAEIELPNWGLVATGQAQIAEDGIDLTLALEQTRTLAFEDVGLYWPPYRDKGARHWVVTNLSEGRLTEAFGGVDAHVSFAPQASEEKQDVRMAQFEIKRLSFDAAYENARVRYLEGMPAVEDVAGRVGYDGKVFDITFTQGHIGAARLIRGSAPIRNFDNFDLERIIRIDLKVETPFRQAMKILDAPRLRFGEQLGLSPERVSGQGVVDVFFEFPLMDGLGYEHVDLEATAQLENVAVSGIAMARDLTQAQLDLTVRPHDMQVQGRGKFDDIPITLKWQESFDKSAEICTQVLAKGWTDQAQRSRFGLDFLSPYIAGRNQSSVHYTADCRGGATINVEAELENTAIDIWFLGYDKPKGKPARAAASLQLSDGKLISVSEFSFWDANVFALGDVSFDVETEKVEQVRVQRLVYGDTDVAIEALALDTGGFALGVKGSFFDFRPILSDEDDIDLEAVPGYVQATPPEDSREQALEIVMELDRAIGGRNTILEDVRVATSFDGDIWQQLDLKAKAGNGDLTIAYAPDAEDGDTHNLNIVSSDAGAALRFLDITSSVFGGTLEIEGENFSGEKPNRMRGHARITQFLMSDAPILARIINALSLTGLLDLLGRDGIHFERLKTDFEWRGDLLTFQNARTSGASLGLTANGAIDLDSKTVESEGTVVPVSGISNIVGAIPLVGDLLTGGEEGAGIFAATYRVRGGLEDPIVSVNPLSAFAPGLIRRILFQGGDSPAEKAEAALDAALRLQREQDQDQDDKR